MVLVVAAILLTSKTKVCTNPTWDFVTESRHTDRHDVTNCEISPALLRQRSIRHKSPGFPMILSIPGWNRRHGARIRSPRCWLGNIPSVWLFGPLIAQLALGKSRMSCVRLGASIVDNPWQETVPTPYYFYSSMSSVLVHCTRTLTQNPACQLHHLSEQSMGSPPTLPQNYPDLGEDQKSRTPNSGLEQSYAVDCGTLWRIYLLDPPRVWGKQGQKMERFQLFNAE